MTDAPHFPPNPRIACIGEVMVELSSPDFARGTAQIGIAGDTYNTAVYLARALKPVGGEISYITAVGSDQLSEDVIRTCQREGLDTDLIARHPNRTVGLYSIQLDPDGERAFTYWRGQSAARCIFGEIGPAFDALFTFDAIYLSAITLAILPADVRMRLVAACAEVKSRGTPVIFDSNFRPRLWASADDAGHAIDAMWRATTIALPSADDEALLHPGIAPEQIAWRIAERGPGEVILKCGPDGPLILTRGALTATTFPPASRVVDTTAAGDSFNAGYIAARASGADPETAARAGHDLAVQVIGMQGAIIPWHVE